LGLAALSGAAFAQVGPSAFTTDNVVPANPFGELPVDPATIDLNNVAAFLDTLTVEQRTELQQRCAVISANPMTYEAAAVTLCTSVVAAAAGEGAAPAAPMELMAPAPAP
jgi:hypothetical protein